MTITGIKLNWESRAGAGERRIPGELTLASVPTTITSAGPFGTYQAAADEVEKWVRTHADASEYRNVSYISLTMSA